MTLVRRGLDLVSPAAALVATVLVAGGCSSESSADAAARGSAAPTSSSTTAAPADPPGSTDSTDSGAPVEPNQPTAPHGAPGHTEGAVPESTSGPLSADQVPPATALGPDWEPYVDPGGHEAGFAGNGNFVRARNTAELPVMLVPLGCPGVDALPRIEEPLHALEATYRDDQGEPAVALALHYADEATPRTSLERYVDLLGTCQPGTDSQLVVDVERPAADTVLAVRRASDDDGTWYEVVVAEGPRLGFLLIHHPAGPVAPDLQLLAADLAARIAV